MCGIEFSFNVLDAQTKALESVLDKVAANGWFPGDAEEGDFIDPTLRQGAMINPGYSPAMPAREGGMINPGVCCNPPETRPTKVLTGLLVGYVGAGVPAGVQPGYELIDPAESEGFIQISRTSFTCADGIYGVTFQPCVRKPSCSCFLSDSNTDYLDAKLTSGSSWA